MGGTKDSCKPLSNSELSGGGQEKEDDVTFGRAIKFST